jgi:hypothetical protein
MLANFTSLKKLCAMLCVALALVFAASAVASIITSVQHMNGTSGNHEHVLFSNISLDDKDHHSDKHSGHGSSGHHHHGDISTGMASLVPSGVAKPIVTGEQRLTSRNRVRISVRLSLPERPPRVSHSSV